MRARLASLNESIQALGDTKVIRDKFQAEIDFINTKNYRMEQDFDD